MGKNNNMVTLCIDLATKMTVLTVLTGDGMALLDFAALLMLRTYSGLNLTPIATRVNDTVPGAPSGR